MGKIIEEQDIRTEVERKIVIGLIMSTNFCSRIFQVYKPEYFELQYAKIIISWIKRYYKEYKKAPNKMIQDIYEIEKYDLDFSIRRIVFRFLISLSRDFASDGEKFNVDYYFNLAADYFTQRETEILFDEGNKLLTLGRIGDAKNLIDASKSVKIGLTGSFRPFDSHEIKIFESEGRGNRLFTFPGHVGRLFGNFQRSWFVSVVAPEKRGKSWWLLEIAFQALVQGLKVFIFSFEMNKHVLKNRIYKRLCALPDRDALDEINEKGYLVYPVFDCRLNQLNKCNLAKRLSSFGLYTSSERPVYNLNMKYKPCVYCRTRYPERYQPAYWFKGDRSKNKLMTTKRIKSKVDDFIEMFGDNLVVQSYPAFSANSNDIQRDLDYWDSKGFITDVIIDDYLDIHADEPKGKFQDERGKTNVRWKMGKYMADTRCCLYVTADQATMKARKRRSVTQMDTSEDKRKDAHVDMKCAINQMPKENIDDVMRLSVLFNRHRKVLSKEVMVLQKLSIAQPMLDSQILPYKENKEEHGDRIYKDKGKAKKGRKQE